MANDLSASSANSEKKLATSFEQIYAQELDRVYRYLYFRLGSVEDAQDITAQTFMAAWRQFSNFRGESSPSTWLLGIARHKLNDHFRSREFVQGKRNVAFETVAELPDRGQSLLESTTQQLQLEEVTHTLSLLAPDRADALALRLFASMSAAEIAAILGKSEDAVKMLIHRGLNELKRRINQHE